MQTFKTNCRKDVLEIVIDANHKTELKKSDFILDKETGERRMMISPTVRIVIERSRMYSDYWQARVEEFIGNHVSGKEWEDRDIELVHDTDRYQIRTYKQLIERINRVIREIISKRHRSAVKAETVTVDPRPATVEDFEDFIPAHLLSKIEITESNRHEEYCTLPGEESRFEGMNFSVVIDGITVTGFQQENSKGTQPKSSKKDVRRNLDIRLQTEEFWTDACTVQSRNTYGDSPEVTLSHGSGGVNNGVDSVTHIRARIRIFELAILIAETWAAKTGAAIR